MKVLSNEFRYVPIGVHQFPSAKRQEILSSAIAGALESFINDSWLRVVSSLECPYPWVGLERNSIPSPVIRIDMAPVEDPQGVVSGIYEIESRPGGLGIVLDMFPEYVPLAKRSMRTYCPSGFIGVGEVIQGDRRQAEIVDLPHVNDLGEIDSQGLYWVRHDTPQGRGNEYSEDILRRLEMVSAVSVRSDGMKDDLVELGLARSLVREDDENLPWDRSFAVKPRVGTWAQDVGIFDPEATRRQRKDFGYSSKSQIERIVARYPSGGILLQEFVSPREVCMQIFQDDPARTCFEIWRVYLVYDPDQEKYVFVGGLTIGSPRIKVHMTNESYMRPLGIL